MSVLKYAFYIGMASFFMAFAPVNVFAADAPVATPVTQTATPMTQFVQELGNQALTSLTAKDLPHAERSARVRALLVKYFDIQTIGRFVLGPYWSQATEAQRQQYLALFENMIVQTYTQRFADYSGQSFTVKGVISSDNGGQDSIVSSEIVQPNGPPVHVNWRVRNENGTLKVADVFIENVSMSITQRADFASIIQNGGGSIDALLTALKNHDQAQ